ncbi:Addiction module toxin, Txe/YoeB [Beggiatoa sp. PS]|nr:Addiction module toxin, Txe/YoeB [Beggiatoa sp. PS]
MRGVIFEENTLQEYENYRIQDKKLHQKLFKILTEMQRGDPTQGTGKPEPLKYGYSGLYSRRLSQKDRLIYRFDDEYIYIHSIGGHYDDH